MRIDAKFGLLVAVLAVGTLGAADVPLSHTSREALIGAWRLVNIEVDGREVDPFYGSGSRGLLLYDASGWFSVQIEGAARPAMPVPSVRPEVALGDSTARLKAAALDSYYAYYGTWSFDAATSTVTHHAKGALYPGEDAANYAQHVEIAGRRLIFSRSQSIGGRATVQTKSWERVSAD